MIENLRNGIIYLAIRAIEKKINGAEITEALDHTLDAKIESHSEKIQRGPLTNFLLEMVEGLWSEDKEELRNRVKIWYNYLEGE